MKNKNTFLVACVSCIVILLTFCYFGINLSWKSTYSATTTYSCLNGSTPVDFNNTYVCVTDGFDLKVSADMSSATCLFSSSTDRTDSSSGISCAAGTIGADFTTTYECTKTLTSIDNYCITKAIESSSSDDKYTYTIFFNAMGGNSVSDLVATSDDLSISMTIPATSKDGYKFCGWNLDMSDTSCSSENLITAGSTLDDMWDGWSDGSTEYEKEAILYAVYEKESDGSTYTLTLTEKTGMVYNGSAQSANTATTNTNDTISYWYYTDSACTVQTSGQSPIATGGAPADAGQYYVKAELDNHAVSSACVPHTIAPKSVAVAWGSNTSFTYNGNAQGPTASVTTGINGESMTVLTTKAAVVGSHTSTASCSSVTGGRAKCSNYTLTNTSKSFAIVAAEVKTYTVTYDENGSNVTGVPGPDTKTAGVALTLSSVKPTRTGYTFTGWNTSADGKGTSYSSGASYKTDANLTLYAQWDINEYTISYEANGGKNAPSSQTKEYGKSIKLSSDIPTRTGYTFTGWNTSADGTGTSYAAGANYTKNNDLKLYAQWSLSSANEEPESQVYKATFEANGGTLSGNSTLTCTTTTSSCIVTGLPTATKSGYTFTGWGTSSSCASGNKDSLTLSKNTTYYACYTKNATTTPDKDNNQNVNTNPTTGDIAIAITWFVGLLAVGYSFYYFKSVKQN